VLLLHPQQRQAFIEILTSKRIEKKIFFSKKIQKSLWDLKTDVTFAPRKTSELIERLVIEKKEKGMKNFFKKTSKNICRFEISFLLLHPL